MILPGTTATTTGSILGRLVAVLVLQITGPGTQSFAILTIAGIRGAGICARRAAVTVNNGRAVARLQSVRRTTSR